MSELKPCPFCGKKALVHREESCCGQSDSILVRCSDGECGADGWYWDDGDKEMEAVARAQWNNRPGEDRLQKALKYSESIRLWGPEAYEKEIRQEERERAAVMVEGVERHHLTNCVERDRIAAKIRGGE